MKLSDLPRNSLRKHPGRTFGIVSLVALLAAVVFGGTVVISSLRSGLVSLEKRLGADIIVAPKEAASKFDLEEVLIEGTPKNFYMDRSFLDTISQVEGVEAVSPQFYLATVKAGCCTMPVQVIGFDPKTDFSIQPWIARSYSSDLKRSEVVVGSSIEGAIGSELSFFGVPVTIVAKLDKTGTSLDTSVFSTDETIQDLIAGSVEQGIDVHAGNNPAQVISTVQIKVANSARVEDVKDDINLHVRGVKAIAAKSLTTGVADSISGVANVIEILMVCVWLLCAGILFAAFSLLGKQRANEFAVLRVAGASQKSLFKLAMGEAALESCIGAFVGVGVAATIIFSFSRALEMALGLPFLLPSMGAIAFIALATLGLAVVVGALASLIASRRLARVDAALLLRSE